MYYYYSVFSLSQADIEISFPLTFFSFSTRAFQNLKAGNGKQGRHQIVKLTKNLHDINLNSDLSPINLTGSNPNKS